MLQYSYPHLKHIAPLPCETQNVKLSQITQERCCKSLIIILSINRFPFFHRFEENI